MKSEKEKMLAGELYVALDPQLTAERKRARQLTHRLNVTDYGDEDATQAIVAALLPNADPTIWLEPPFYCDYGYNIYAERERLLQLQLRRAGCHAGAHRGADVVRAECADLHGHPSDRRGRTGQRAGVRQSDHHRPRLLDWRQRHPVARCDDRRPGDRRRGCGGDERRGRRHDRGWQPGAAPPTERS